MQIDDVQILGESNLATGPMTWTPYHIPGVGESWPPYVAAASIEAGSALDFSTDLEAPAGSHGFIKAEGGHLVFEDGTPARFFGVYAMPPVPFLSADRVDPLADRLARSGVNLVVVGDIDAPLGPGGSLIDDYRDDTGTIDPVALTDFDHFVAALKERGIYLAIALQGQARFRSGDNVPSGHLLPAGGGAAAAFDPAIRERTRRLAEALFSHVNPETGLALRDEPALAWVTLAGSLTLFDLIDHPDSLPKEQADALRDLMRSDRLAGRSFWKAAESSQWSALADDLRSMGVKVPIAGSSHDRREPEFVAAQKAEGLDLIDDRLFWEMPRFASPDGRSLLLRPTDELGALARAKRDRDRPYVVSQYASYTDGAWALPFEGPDLLFASVLARAAGWDALCRRGVGRLPEILGLRRFWHGRRPGRDHHAGTHQWQPPGLRPLSPRLRPGPPRPRPDLRRSACGLLGPPPGPPDHRHAAHPRPHRPSRSRPGRDHRPDDRRRRTDRRRHRLLGRWPDARRDRPRPRHRRRPRPADRPGVGRPLAPRDRRPWPSPAPRRAPPRRPHLAPRRPRHRLSTRFLRPPARRGHPAVHPPGAAFFLDTSNGRIQWEFVTSPP